MEAACPVLHLHCWHKFGRYPSKKIWYMWQSLCSEFLPFWFWICIRSRGVPRIPMDLPPFAEDGSGDLGRRTLWKHFKRKVEEKSAATSIRRSGEVSQQVVLVSGLCAGFAKIWAEDHTVVVTQWIPPLLPEAFEKPRHAWRGGKNAWRGFLLSQVPQLYCIPK